MTKAFREIIRATEFEKDFKKLCKRFRSLPSDLEIFIDSELALYHKLKIDNRGIFPISGLPASSEKIFKARKFACKSLKGRGVHSGIRVIHGYDEAEDRIVLIEIYFKGDKENQDKERIENYLKRESSWK